MMKLAVKKVTFFFEESLCSEHQCNLLSHVCVHGYGEIFLKELKYSLPKDSMDSRVVITNTAFYHTFITVNKKTVLTVYWYPDGGYRRLL